MPSKREQGAGWEVLRGFISTDLAETAGREALLLVDGGFDGSNWYRKYSIERVGQSGLIQHSVSAWEPTRYPRHPDTVCADEVAFSLFQNLIIAHRQASRYNDGTVRSFFVNEYAPGGHTRAHRDRYEGSTVAVALIGESVWSVKDPVSGVLSFFEFEPGDAMHLINPRQQRLRPMHKVWNTGTDRRLSLVE